jgi:hypothetical protein
MRPGYQIEPPWIGDSDTRKDARAVETMRIVQPVCAIYEHEGPWRGPGVIRPLSG